MAPAGCVWRTQDVRGVACGAAGVDAATPRRALSAGRDNFEAGVDVCRGVRRAAAALSGVALEGRC